jgi:hypothetical protein
MALELPVRRIAIAGCLSASALAFAFSMGACSDPCTEPGPADACHHADPAERGMLAVGVRTLQLTDPARIDADGEPRRLTVEVWYPASPPSGAPQTDHYDLLAMMPAALRPVVDGMSSPDISQQATRDAPLDTRFAPYPLLLFSHGLAALRIQNYQLMTHLASHGYIVAAPDHTGNTVWDLLGRTGQFDTAGVFQSLVNRPADLSFVADQLGSPTGALPGAVDLQRVAALGHSFGATTSIAISARDSDFYDARVSVAIAMAPATAVLDLLGAGPAQSGAPLMIMGGYRDATLSYTDEMLHGYEEAPPPKLLVSVPQAGHYSFADVCDFDIVAMAAPFGFDASYMLDDGCSTDFPSMADMRRIQRYFSTALFNFYLRGDPDAVDALDPAALPADLAALVVLQAAGLESP